MKKEIVAAAVVVLGLMALVHLGHTHSPRADHKAHADPAQHPAQGSPQR